MISGFGCEALRMARRLVTSMDLTNYLKKNGIWVNAIPSLPLFRSRALAGWPKGHRNQVRHRISDHVDKFEDRRCTHAENHFLLKGSNSRNERYFDRATLFRFREKKKRKTFFYTNEKNTKCRPTGRFGSSAPEAEK